MSSKIALFLTTSILSFLSLGFENNTAEFIVVPEISYSRGVDWVKSG